MGLQVDFHILKEESEVVLHQFLSRLLEQGLQHKQRYYIHTPAQASAHAIDEYLWQAEPEKFIPHNLFGEGPYPAPPVQIGWQHEINKQHNILINLCPEIPEFFKLFQKTIEIVSNDDSQLTTARNKYKKYRQIGCQISYQDYRKHERV